MSEPLLRLTSGRLLTRNASINLASHAAPILVALVAIPFLIRGLGTERFGVLTLIWMAIGYFSLFDLGLGRALTQVIAERLGRSQEEGIGHVAWTALTLMGLLGMAGAALLLLATPWAVRDLLEIPAAYERESEIAFLLLALSLPAVITTAGLRGILEAYQRVGLVNAVRVPMGILSFAGPLAVLPFSNSLVPVAAVSVGVRIAGWVAHLALCLYAVPRLRREVGFQRSHVRRLLSFGGWMTLSMIISPLMVYLDRFLIGATLSITAVAYYVTPYEVATKLWLVPGALLGVLFPAFATSFAGDRMRTVRIFDLSMRVLVLILFPVVLLLVVFAYDALALWVGHEFAREGYRVLQLLAIGILINSVAMAAITVLHGIGKPRETALLHLLELPFYLVVLWFFVARWGIVGAAAAWTLRVTADALALCALSGWALVEARPVLKRMAWGLSGVVALLAASAFLPAALPLRVAWTAGALLLVGTLAWLRMAPVERLQLRAGLRSILRPQAA